ncbi:MAG: GNAT family N-acetyltransferase [Gammaproteobacteria bacterium]|nr:GNAT family N-acetyltransferase [Gammaproteobacteria bacterium]
MSNLEVTVKSFSELSNAELYSFLRLRAEIFIVEQQCIYQDLDDFDQEAVHVCAYADRKLVAYTRLIAPGIKYPGASIGRVITKSCSRNRGIGSEIVACALRTSKALWPYSPITISAQEYLQNFYARFGFEKQSDAYMEDGIPHIEMTVAAFQDD